MPNQPPYSEDEISLPGIRKIIKQFFSFLFWVWAFIVLVLRRNKFLIGGGLVVGLMLGYLYYISRPVYYKGTMIVLNNELTKRTYGEMIKQLNGTMGGTNTRLASELKAPEQVAANILFIDSRNMNDDPLSADTSTRMRQPFKIIAGLKSNVGLDTVQSLLLAYLNNAPYLKTLREEQSRLYNERLNFINAELQKLDSLKSEYNRFLASSKISATFYNNAFNPADIYQQSNNLFNQRESTLRWLYIDKNAITLIDELKTRNTPNSISLFKALLVLGVAGFLIAFLLAFLRETSKRLS